jgi:pimeloyl-ACP methyl ester carboxylesterase
MARITQMRSILLGTVVPLIALCLISSCGNNKPPGEHLEVNAKDSLPLAPAISSVRGEAGMIHIIDTGTGNIPVIFLHSFGGSSEQWMAQISHTSETRRSIAFDFRGHGLSDTPANNNYSVASLSTDLQTVIDSLHLDRFILVGHSMGGSAAIAYTGQHPDKVVGLMVVGTPGKTPPTTARQVIAALNSPGYQKVMDDYMKKLLTNSRPDVMTKVNDGVKKISKDASIALIKALFEYDPTADLPKYHGPVMIVSTDADQAGSLHQVFPAIPFALIKGTSHWAQMDKPDDFNSTLDGFLKTIPVK